MYFVITVCSKLLLFRQTRFLCFVFGHQKKEEFHQHQATYIQEYLLMENLCNIFMSRNEKLPTIYLDTDLKIILLPFFKIGINEVWIISCTKVEKKN